MVMAVEYCDDAGRKNGARDSLAFKNLLINEYQDEGYFCSSAENSREPRSRGPAEGASADADWTKRQEKLHLGLFA